LVLLSASDWQESPVPQRFLDEIPSENIREILKAEQGHKFAISGNFKAY